MNVDHPDSDTLRAFRQHRLSGAAVREVALHIGECDRCAAVEPQAAKTLLDALVDDVIPSVSEGPGRWAAQRWLMAAAIIVAVLALSAIALLLRRPTPDAVPVTASNPPAPVAPAPAPRVVASLADGGGQIALLEDGTITGVEVQPQDAEDARAVLSGRSIVIPTFIAAMPGAVRGGEASAHPLRAVAPFRSAVLESRPRFSWTPVRDARSYRVAVFDADYEELAQSEALAGTSWTPSAPLPAGVDLSWHVVADTSSGELSSAGSNRGEAVFRVLTPRERAEVEAGKAHYRGSGLLRGLLYSRHGLLHDAEREFRGLAEQNPDSPVARALVDSVRR
jgi:hypothetical protein